MIFALLEEILTLQMSFNLINVWEPNFQRPLIWAFIIQSGNNNGSRNKCRRSKIQNGSEDPLEVIHQVSNHRGVSGARSNKRSDNKCNSESKSMFCDGNKGATIATFGESSASELIFAVIKILARTVTNGRLSH